MDFSGITSLKVGSNIVPCFLWPVLLFGDLQWKVQKMQLFLTFVACTIFI